MEDAISFLYLAEPNLTFPLPVDFPAIEVTLVAFVASVRNDAQSLA